MNIAGYLILFCLICIPVAIYILVKKYLEEKNKAILLASDKDSFIKYYNTLEKRNMYVRPLRYLLFGLLLLLVGLGMAISTYYKYIMMNNFPDNISQDWMRENFKYFTMNSIFDTFIVSVILIMSGIALLIFYVISSKKVKEIEEKQNKMSE
jgi:hypothetical protein